MADPASERRALARKKTLSLRRRRAPAQDKSARAEAIASQLEQAYPGIACPLTHRNSFELLVAVILSAQCTDAAVNRVTPAFFHRYPTPATLSHATVERIEPLIRSLGLFRAKARSLKRCAQQLQDRHNGQVPATLEELTGLAGVGRKTANVILGHAFNKPGIAVDTHCKRLSRRLALTREQEPTKIEHDLGRLLAPQEWTGFSHRLILHGRAVCHARKPTCELCVLRELCPSREGPPVSRAGKQIQTAR
jgi:endonuclease III